MAHVISDLSKYVIVFFMALYTLLCYVALFRKEDDQHSIIFTLQVICMFMVHFLGFCAICLETGDISYIIFYGFQQILLFASIALYRVIYPEVDRLVVNNMCMFLAISFIILTRISYDKSIRQFGIVTVSLIVGLFIPFLVQKLRFLKSIPWVYGLVGVLALAIVAILGATTHGSKISYTIAGFTFQPSEFVKILFVFFIAGMMKESTKFYQVALSAIAAAVHIMILVFSKDLGSAVIFFATYLVMIFIATKNYFYLLLGLLGGGGASYIGYKLFHHVQVRIIAWLDPWNNIDNSGYQITQSLFAIGTGGWFGMGLYQGEPTSIPYVEQDFVFSAVSEEMGVLFGLCLILVCLSCFIMFMTIAMRIREDFYRYIAVGLSTMYIFQVFLTIGGGTRFIPLTGVTLPLVSYGGSSVLTTIIMFCIIQGLYLIREQEGTKNAKKQRSRRNVIEESEDEEE